MNVFHEILITHYTGAFGNFEYVLVFKSISYLFSYSNIQARTGYN